MQGFFVTVRDWSAVFLNLEGNFVDLKASWLRSSSHFFGPVGILSVSFLMISSAGFPPLHAG